MAESTQLHFTTEHPIDNRTLKYTAPILLEGLFKQPVAVNDPKCNRLLQENLRAVSMALRMEWRGSPELLETGLGLAWTRKSGLCFIGNPLSWRRPWVG